VPHSSDYSTTAGAHVFCAHKDYRGSLVIWVKYDFFMQNTMLGCFTTVLTCTLTHTHAHTHTYTCRHTHTHTHTHTLLKCINTHTQTHTHAHAHTHTHICTHSPPHTHITPQRRGACVLCEKGYWSDHSRAGSPGTISQKSAYCQIDHVKGPQSYFFWKFCDHRRVLCVHMGMDEILNCQPANKFTM